MYAMILSDFFLMRNYFVKMAVGFVVLGAFVTLVAGNAPWIILFVSFILPLSWASSLLMLDARRDWEGFRLALPLTRASVMRGRYVTYALIVFGGALVGMVAYLLAWAISLGAPAASALAMRPIDFDGQILVLVVAASIAIPMATMALILPPLARFSLTRATRFIPVVPLILFAAASLLRDQLQPIYDAMAPFADDVENIMFTPTGTFIAAGAIVMIGIALYLASCFASMRIYEKREF